MGRSVTRRVRLSGGGTKGTISTPFTFSTRSCTIEDDLAPRRGAVQFYLIASVRAQSWKLSEPSSLEQFCNSKVKSLGKSVNCRHLRIGAACFTFST